MKPPFVTSYSIQNYFSAEKGIEEAYVNNFDYWYVDLSLVNDEHNKWNSKRIDNMNSLVDKYNVKPILHGNFKIPLASDVDELRVVAIEYVKNEINLANSMNAPLIIHGGAIVEPRLINSTKRKCLIKFIESVEILLNYAQKKNVEIYLENLSNYKKFYPFHYIFTNAEEISSVVERIPEIKLFIDIGHANIGNDPIEFIKLFHQQVVGMSFSNNNGVNDQHLSLAKGIINYHAIVSEIINCNWKGIVSFETRGRKPKDSMSDLSKIYNSVLLQQGSNVA